MGSLGNKPGETKWSVYTSKSKFMVFFSVTEGWFSDDFPLGFEFKKWALEAEFFKPNQEFDVWFLPQKKSGFEGAIREKIPPEIKEERATYLCAWLPKQESICKV